MTFNEARFGRGGFEIFENRIEPLNMAHLQDAVFLSGKLDQFRRLRGIVSHGFFHKNVFTLRKQLFGDFEMGRGRRGNVQRIGIGGGIGNGVEDLNAVFGGNFICRVRVGVINPGELDLPGLCQFSIDARVVLAQRANSENSDADFVCVCCLMFRSHRQSLPARGIF